MTYTPRRITFISLFALACLFAVAPYARAETATGPLLTLRTESGFQFFTDVAEGSFVMPNGVKMFSLTFSLHAFGDDMYLPMSVLRHADAVQQETRYAFEDRTGHMIGGGVSAAGLLAHDADVVDGTYRIPEGETRSFTLLAAFYDGTQDREDRMRVSGMQLVSGNGKTLELSSGEVGPLKTGFLSID